jgi:hypothetical protein
MGPRIRPSVRATGGVEICIEERANVGKDMEIFLNGVPSDQWRSVLFATVVA